MNGAPSCLAVGRVGEERSRRIRLRAVLAIAFALALVFGLGAGGRIALAKSAPVPALRSDAYEARVFALVNAERARRGLRRLSPSRCGEGFATRWADHIARDERLRHQSVRRVIATCSASRGAENIAAGVVTPERMVEMWMKSRGHRANILNPRLTHAGVGAARAPNGAWYGVQVFLGDR